MRGQGLEEGNHPGPVHAADGAGVVPVRVDGLAVSLCVCICMLVVGMGVVHHVAPHERFVIVTRL